MENENELPDIVISFCEALKNFKSNGSAKVFIDAILLSDSFNKMRDCAYNEKMFLIRNPNQIQTNN